MAAATISVDEFQALEQKVLQTVELIKKERELRAAADARAQELEARVRELEAHAQELESKIAESEGRRTQLEGERSQLEQDHTVALTELTDLRERSKSGEAVTAELDAMKRERESVRQRVEAMLAQMDQLM